MTRLDAAPCPHRILDDLGGAFSMGFFGGGVWYAIKGLRTSARGRRISGAVEMVRMRSPALAGGFAIWGGIFSSYDCMFLHMRGKEDPWNAIMSGAATGATLACRAGVRVMAQQGLVGGVFLALIEGLGIMMNKTMSKMQAAQNNVQTLTNYEAKSRPGAMIEAPALQESLREEQTMKEEDEFDFGQFRFDDDEDDAFA
jgi:mitochondrial import inner membrane translocase subunit TIM17